MTVEQAQLIIDLLYLIAGLKLFEVVCYLFRKAYEFFNMFFPG